MKIVFYRGGAWDRSASLIVAGDGVYSVSHAFGMSLPFPRILCNLRGLAPLRRFRSPAEEDALGAFAPSYHVLTEPGLPSVEEERLYQYVVARNGVFLLARSQDIELCLPITSQGGLPKLADATPMLHFRHPRVEGRIVAFLLERALAARDATGLVERLFCLTYQNGEWHLHEPPQQATRESVEATEITPEYVSAPLIGHSHHTMPAYFSPGDDRDELERLGCKVCFVLGRITTRPELLARVCVHGYSWPVAASTFFHLPDYIHDSWRTV